MAPSTVNNHKVRIPLDHNKLFTLTNDYYYIKHITLELLAEPYF